MGHRDRTLVLHVAIASTVNPYEAIAEAIAARRESGG